MRWQKPAVSVLLSLQLTGPLLATALLLHTPVVWAQEEKSLEDLRRDLSKIERSIEITRGKIREVKDVAFLPDLYFVLAELHIDRSRYVYTIERQKNPKAPLNELDFSESKKSKRAAIDVYQRILDTFPKSAFLDKALFFMAHEHRELGAFEDMLKTYKKLVTEHPKSPFWEESQVIIGDYLLEQKKDPGLALEIYQRVLSRPSNPFIPLARYKTGWCYINLDKFYEALRAFEGVLTVDRNINLDDLPELYKKTDVRRDALVAMVWPYSEQKKLDSDRANALNYFERLAPDRASLLKGLERLAKRLMLKNKWDDALPVYIRLVEISTDLERRLETFDKFYEAFKKSKRVWPLEVLTDPLTDTIIRMRHSSSLKNDDRLKYEKNLEIYFRDFATSLQGRAKSTAQARIYKEAVHAYKNYLLLFPNTKYAQALLLNQAESYFNLKDYVQAGIAYEKLANRRTKKKEAMDSAIQAFAFALKTPEKLSKIDLAQAREGFRDVGLKFYKMNPKDPANPMILFNIARTYYDERDFTQAVKSFNTFINAYPTHKEVTTAGNLILDAYNQREDFDGLIRAGRLMLSNKRITDQAFKRDVAEIVKQAEFKKIQNKVGDPKSKEYAAQLMKFASKYQGTNLGDQALYEAFTSMKAKKDLGAYDPGEQLLFKFGDSRYAKEVVAAMGQMALNTADYSRVSKYFETFAQKYPKEPDSPKLMKNAAEIRELMGDYKEAADNYRTLGASYSEDVGRQFILAQDWPQAAQSLSARPTQSLKWNYWTGLALHRQGQAGAAKPYFDHASKMSARTPEEKKMAAHSLFLIASQALRDYEGIRLGSGNETTLVKSKDSKLQALKAQLNRVISYGNGRWTIASLYQLGRAHQEFGSFVRGASIPAGLNGAQVAQFKQIIEQKAAVFDKQANQYFKSCVENAEKYEVFTGFVKGCASRGQTEVDEAAEDRQASKSTDSNPPEALAIRKRLFDAPRNADLLLKLGAVYVKAGDYSLARTIISRALEVRPGYARAEGLLGTTLLFMNDLEGAREAFKQALSHSARDPHAAWGLAALYKQFGFNTKLRAALSRARGTSKPTEVTHPWVAEL